MHFFFFFQAEDGIRDRNVTGVQTCALPISYSDKVKSDLEVPAKRHMKNVEVPTGEKSMFGLGKEIMKTEKKPTKNVVISERDYKNLVTAARDNDKLKQHVRNLMSTD